jgi:hypothetical protein
MSRSRIITLAIKEARALAIPWLAGIAVLLISLATGRWRGLAWLTYFLTAAVVGGLSVGHEYNDRTLDWLLAQPIRRSRLFAIKQAVLAAMLLILSAVALPLLPGGAPPETDPRLALVFTFAGGLFIAPHLTMLSRSALAGAVFTGAIPGVLLTAGSLLGVLRYGLNAWEVNRFQFEFMKWGFVMQCAISAVLGWRTFCRLESAGDGRRRSPSWSAGDRPQSAPASVRQRPLWLLLKKELRLQSMPFFFSGFYVLGWMGAIVASRALPEALVVFTVLTVFYCGLIALLVGALASAEERLLGTLEWQMLLPIASGTQWLVKVAVALCLTLALGWGLPVLMLQMSVAGRPVLHLPLTQPLFVGALVMLTASGLYTSSIATSGLRAFLLSIPALFAAGTCVTVLLDRVAPAVYTMVRSRSLEPGTFFVQRIAELSPLVVGGALALLVLTFALANHRSADRSAGRISRQVTWLTASLAGGVMIVTVISSL